MGPNDILEIARDAIFVMLKIGAPMMLTALVVGLIISLFQALTQIQEMTLAFVPKIITLFVVFVLFLPFMVSTLIAFTQGLAGRIAGVG
ncbi:MAG: flagellar biosynthesis protein FliQ [Rhodospirillales bacterium]|nr:flagellar biosynthesis protein FliQ [Rhodospirillales bacterium]